MTTNQEPELAALEWVASVIESDRVSEEEKTDLRKTLAILWRVYDEMETEG